MSARRRAARDDDGAGTHRARQSPETMTHGWSGVAWKLMLAVGLVSTSVAAACGCAGPRTASVMLGAVGANCVAFELNENGQVSARGLCLGPAGDGRVVMLPCTGEDIGLQWAYSPFHSGALLNHATMQCLVADGKQLELGECASDDRWNVTSSGEIVSGNAVVGGQLCFQIGQAPISPPCMLNETIVLTPEAPHPLIAKLGVLPKTVGGDITITAEVFSAGTTGNQWARIVDLGNGKTSDNILIGFPRGESQNLEYQVYHDVQMPTPPGIVSTASFPKDRWVRVVAVHHEGTASLYWTNASGALELQAQGPVDPAANIVRTSNLVGVSNWPADAAFDGKIRGVAIYSRALETNELALVGTTTAPISGMVNLCAAGPPPPAPAPPRHAAFHLNEKNAVGTVEPELYGHDLEFTRHDLFTGFSAELVANRKFAVPTPCKGSYSCWPPQVQAEMASGFTPRWRKIGAAELDKPYWSDNSSLVTGDVGHSVHCVGAGECGVSQGSYLDGFNSGMSFGNAIVLQEAKAYSLRVVLKAPSKINAVHEAPAAASKVMAKIVSSAGEVLFTASFLVVPSGEWATSIANFSAPATDLNATLQLTATGEWWLGSVSLTPTTGVWRGMRLDVVEKLKQTGFTGLFRYPGGCYAPFYRWKIGLLDADARPPIETPPGYCDAVAGGVNAYTDGMMENGISTDDYLALCEYVGLVPAITIRFQMGTDEDVQEARDWVEYVNGGVETPYGALRAKNGHPKPYNVTYWYLGNEIAQQARQPNYPNNSTLIRPPGVQEYKKMLTNIVPPMLKASGTKLRLLTVSGSVQWNAAWAEAVGDHIYASSFHDGYFPLSGSFTQTAVTLAAKRPRTEFMKDVAALRTTLDKTGKKIAISADEWGLGPPWRVQKFSVAHGMYAAGFLGAVTRGARTYNLKFRCVASPNLAMLMKE